MDTRKVRLFFEGRKGLLPKIEAACRPYQDIIWFHVASFGEFEEARPVIEATRVRFPGRKILLTVFSPSVYEPMKTTTGWTGPSTCPWIRRATHAGSWMRSGPPRRSSTSANIGPSC